MAVVHTNVLVVGAGIAGTCAALSAAEFFANEPDARSSENHPSTNPTVMLASKGPLFSGSSFFEGTWGLGLIAPDGAQDEEDLARTIVRVGCGTANETMVRSFVAGISPSIEHLKRWGVTPKEASNAAADQREYIPCFDHKHRLWRGIKREPYVKAMSARIAEHGIAVKEGWELLDIDAKNHLATFYVSDFNSSFGSAKSDKRAHGEGSGKTSNNPFNNAKSSMDAGGKSSDETSNEKTTVTNGSDMANSGTCDNAEEPSGTSGVFMCVHYDALVLCTGGASSLFTRHLTQDDCCATTQGLAQSIGCHTVNMAFMQFMPGIVSPVQNIVFNEKTFRYMTLDPCVQKQLGGIGETQRLLDMRSGYGPFTCRLDSRKIDFAIHRAGAQGLTLTPSFASKKDLPEFVRTYQTWLEESAGVNANAPLRVAMYAHANNGGICIDQHGYTNVAGIFAAGECTGGMHGADRLGGLSSANGLVFGMRAGKSAAAFALDAANELAAPAPAAPIPAPDLAAPAPAAPAAGVPVTAAPDTTCTALSEPPTPRSPIELPTWTKQASPQATEINKELSALMDTSCMIIREKHQIEETLARIDALEQQLEVTARPTTSAKNAALTRTVQLRLATARIMVDDILHQQTSRGSHYWKQETRI